ncbi:MAG: glycosyltransferase [Sphingomonadaceae bacterium]
MHLGGFTPWEWLSIIQMELLLFAGVFFLVGALDEFAIDLIWLWNRLNGKIRTIRLKNTEATERSLSAPAAIFVPAWREEEVIGSTIRHMLEVWRHPELRLYIGCYRNDSQTIRAVVDAVREDIRLRLVIHDVNGPSTKADCLNRLYAALREDEQRSGHMANMVVLHDAEDMVDPAALGVLDEAVREAEFVQLPVMPMSQRDSRFIGGHYIEEFAESHTKAMVVRDYLRASLPSAGVGCAIRRSVLQDMTAQHRSGPFSAESLTEDYELGLRIHEAGYRSRFVRVRTQEGRLIASRSYFPANLQQAVRQKTRWVHGIALQGWDRTGWGKGNLETWMR